MSFIKQKNHSAIVFSSTSPISARAIRVLDSNCFGIRIKRKINQIKLRLKLSLNNVQYAFEKKNPLADSTYFTANRVNLTNATLYIQIGEGVLWLTKRL